MNVGWKGIITAVALAGMATVGMPAQAQDAATCGTDKTIDIAEMTWPSAAALAHIHAIILDKGYGCNVEVVAGDTVPTSASMLARGTPAIAPELWTSSITRQWDEGLKDGSVVELGPAITDGTVEGWFIPQYTMDKHPDLKDIAGVIAHPELFPDPEDTGKGRFYSCPPGWTCELAGTALFKALDMENKGWNLFSPGSGGALAASIARAFEREEPILFYYWGPTALLGKYDAAQIDLGPVKKDVYACNTDPECDDAPGVTAYPSSPAVVGAAAWIKEDAPNVAEYFGKVGLSNDQISKLLVYGDENNADAEKTARNFLKTEEATWTKWVPEAVAEKVKASLG